MEEARTSGAMYLEIRNPRRSPEGHVEYEVCFLKSEAEAPGGVSKVDYKWSVWHRYSDFEELDK